MTKQLAAELGDEVVSSPATKPTWQPQIGDKCLAIPDPLPTADGGEIKIYETSHDDAAYLWLVTEEAPSMDFPSGHETHAKITLATAERMQEQLAWFVRNHYQVRA